jgi:hypothetical protein
MLLTLNEYHHLWQETVNHILRLRLNFCDKVKHRGWPAGSDADYCPAGGPNGIPDSAKEIMPDEHSQQANEVFCQRLAGADGE